MKAVKCNYLTTALLETCFHLHLCSTGQILVLRVQTESFSLMALWLYLRLKQFAVKINAFCESHRINLDSSLKFMFQLPDECMVSCNSFMNHPSSP